MKEEIEDKKKLITTDATANAVQVIKAAILQGAKGTGPSAPYIHLSTGSSYAFSHF